MGSFVAACGASAELAEEHDRPSLDEAGEHEGETTVLPPQASQYPSVWSGSISVV